MAFRWFYKTLLKQLVDLPIDFIFKNLEYPLCLELRSSELKRDLDFMSYEFA